MRVFPIEPDDMEIYIIFKLFVPNYEIGKILMDDYQMSDEI